jgi:ATP-dependent DNA ligase
MVDSLDEAKAIFEQYLIDGKEGIILKTLNGEWEDKRSKNQIKFKGELECDLLVTGIENGTGKYQGMLGSLICASSDNLITVNVGSGLNDEQRRSLNSDIIGRVVAVKYNARIKSKDGTESLFLPIFIELRDDKTEADSSTDIK